MNSTQNVIFVVDGLKTIDSKLSKYIADKQVWDRECSDIDNSFKRKVSRVKTTAGHIKEYPNWYRTLPDNTLQSVGKHEPRYSEYYSHAPKKPKIPEFEVNNGHLTMVLSEFKTHKSLFKKCICFPLDSQIIFSDKPKKSNTKKLSKSQTKLKP